MCCASLDRDASCRPQPSGPTDGLTMFYKSFGCTQSWRAAIHFWLLWESHFPLNFMLLKGKLTLMTRPTSWSWWKSQSLTLTHKIFRNGRVSEWGLNIMEHDASQWLNHQISVHRDPKKTEKRFQDVIADVSSHHLQVSNWSIFFQVSDCSETKMRRCIKATMNGRCSNCVWNVPELMAFTALLLSFGVGRAELADAPEPIPIGNMIIYTYNMWATVKTRRYWDMY